MDRIFMTGGAGFLGRAILTRFADTQFTIYSRDESKHNKVRRLYPQHNYILGDVRDAERLELAIMGHDVVIHTGAMKYVPQSESNVFEAVSVNVGGSQNVARAAMRAGVQRVVGISTDKACQPVNVYGMTKLLMERIFQEADQLTDTKFNLVRYGNVVSSTDSVIPIFKSYIRRNEDVPLTCDYMTRFWLSIEQAVDLVGLALAEKDGGTVLIPRLKSMSMLNLTRAVYMVERGELSGLVTRPIGRRLGEKIHEDLLSTIEAVYTERISDNLMRMYPVANGPLEHLKAVKVCTTSYNSAEPDAPLTLEEMIEMIKGAPE